MTTGDQRQVGSLCSMVEAVTAIRELLSGTERNGDSRKWGVLKCCFTSTETVGLLGTRRAQDGDLDFHTAPEL